VLKFLHRLYFLRTFGKVVTDMMWLANVSVFARIRGSVAL
jgi:hypothetical protein